MIEFLKAVAPSAGVLFLFWFAIRAIIQADRRERLALERADALRASESPNSQETAATEAQSAADPV